MISRISAFLASRWSTLSVFVVGSLWLGWQSLLLAPTAAFLKYPVLAEQSLEGTLDPDRLLDVSFLYFYIHVAARWLTSSPVILAQIGQVLASAVAVALLFALVRRLSSPGTGLLAAAILLLDRTVAVYTPILEPEPFLLAAVLAFLYFSSDEGSSGAVATGVSLGCALLFRPVLVPMVFLVPLYYWLRNRSSGQIQPSTQRRTVLFLLPVALAFGLLWGRNALLPIPFSATVMNPGAVFYEGNHPWATGLAATYPPLFGELRDSLSDSPDPQHEIYRVFARREAGRDLSVAEVNQTWRSRASEYLFDHPSTALRRSLVKLEELFRGYAWHDLSNAYWRHRALVESRVPAVPFALVAAAGLIGMALASRNWDRWLLLYGVLACQMAATVVVYVSARQKLILVPVLATFAALAVQYIARRRARWAVLGIAVVLLAVMLSLPNDRAIEDRHLWGHLQQSNGLRDRAYTLRSEGRHDEAAEAAARALALTPWRLDSLRPAGLDFRPEGFASRALRELDASGFEPTFSLLFDKATLAIAAGEWETAKAALVSIDEGGHQLARGSYQSSQLPFYRGLVAALQEDWEEARSQLETALVASPGDPLVLALRSVVSDDASSREQLERYFDSIHAGFFVGRAQMELGSPERAVESLARVVAWVPEFRRARIYLAASLGKVARYSEGVDLYRTTVARQPDPVMLEEEIVEMFRLWVAEDPSDPERLAILDEILVSFGISAEFDTRSTTP